LTALTVKHFFRTFERIATVGSQSAQVALQVKKDMEQCRRT